MPADYLMALDAGSGSGRCLLVDVGSGKTWTALRRWTHPPASGTGGLGYDLDLENIRRKLGEASREVLAVSGARPDDVLGIAVTSMRHSTVLLGPDSSVVFATPNQDARAVGEALGWAAGQGEEVYTLGGHWPGPLFTGSRLLWLGEREPDALHGVKVLSLSDWIACSLGAEPVAERSQAAETLLFDLQSRDWAHALVKSKGLPASIFPETVDAGTPIGRLSDEAARHFGLPPGITISAGGADTQCGLLGSGAVAPGNICVVAGTSMPVQVVTDGIVLDGEGRLWSGLHVVPGLYVLESNGLATGSVLEWFAKIVYADYENPVAVMFAEAALSGPGGAGSFSTFGACTFDARRLNMPVGNISMSHLVTPASEGRWHLARSLLEGVALSVRANVEQLMEVTCSGTDELVVSAGMSRSELWTQMVSDVTGKTVAVPAVCEATALGAAVCAGVGAGVFVDLVAGAAELSGVARWHAPGPDSSVYARLYEGWSRTCSLRAASDEHLSGLLTMALLERGEPDGAAPLSFRPRVMVTASMDAEALERLKQLAEVEYAGWREAGRIITGGRELAEALEGYDALITEIDIVDYEALDLLPGLKAVCSCRVDPVNVDVESATAFGIPVFNTPGRNAEAVADLTLGFMIMLLRRLPAAADFLREPGGEAGDLVRMGAAYASFQGRELWRKTVGIVGLGSVGTAVARRVRTGGARVLFFDPLVAEGAGALQNAEKVSLEALLERSDIVSVHAPAKEETRGLLDAGRLAKMKEGAFLINTARASLVDYEALADALESGRLAGAALDVFGVEPPASDDRLVRMGNVIATPHIGGNTLETAAHQGAIAVDQLEALLEGRAPSHILNPEVMDGFDWTGQRREPSPLMRARLAAKLKPTITS
ncbi:MAG: hypothetical protein KJ993_11900 [Actinobacteria bacterium]|nr:hypothetical protein [Actinomycetota bacterium]